MTLARTQGRHHFWEGEALSRLAENREQRTPIRLTEAAPHCSKCLGVDQACFFGLNFEVSAQRSQDKRIGCPLNLQSFPGLTPRELLSQSGTAEQVAISV